MAEKRIILHSDLNSFYASVEMMLNPSLRGKALAVCGSTEDRHGIVLAKSELAKKTGVKTGMLNWEARKCCPGLVIVPPRYGQYLKYSKLARAIYQRFTDRVEAFGMDECWLDLTGCEKMVGDGATAADTIRRTVYKELGMTVSIGVSYNKIFAKLGSDMKKPDAVTVITEEDFREKVWPLPAADLLYVGRATEKKLAAYGIHTIGDVAGASPELLKLLLGVNGRVLRCYASGQDKSRVMPMDYHAPVKSIGQGITCTADLETGEEVWKVFLELSQDIGHKLRLYELSARGVQIIVKDQSFCSRQYQAQLEVATQSPMEMAEKARSLFSRRYLWPKAVRAVTVRAINLIPAHTPRQLILFEDAERRQKTERLESAIENIRTRFGRRAIYSACLMGEPKMTRYDEHEIIMPGFNYQ